ncbi:MAG: Rhodanase C-terminal [Firmicutes bacterium]|nr:Rhodanase C-terminal [Bacillota bacterium]
MPKIVYKCELCGNEFDTENEAAKCESSHYAACANPKCGALFVQIPTSKRYCSKTCCSSEAKGARGNGAS